MKKLIIAVILCAACSFSFGFIHSNETVVEVFTQLEKEVKLYASPTGKCYHYSKACSGKNGVEITMEQAENRGLRPCKKCVH